MASPKYEKRYIAKKKKFIAKAKLKGRPVVVSKIDSTNNGLTKASKTGSKTVYVIPMTDTKNFSSEIEKNDLMLYVDASQELENFEVLTDFDTDYQLFDVRPIRIGLTTILYEAQCRA